MQASGVLRPSVRREHFQTTSLNREADFFNISYIASIGRRGGGQKVVFLFQSDKNSECVYLMSLLVLYHKTSTRTET